MEVLTIRLDPNTVEDLDEEYDAEGFRNRTEYIRAIIDGRDRILENTDENTEPVDSLRERLDELEERVGELESGGPGDRVDRRDDVVDERDQEELVEQREPDDRDIDQDGRDDRGDPLREQMREEIFDIEIPGRDAAVERTRREAVQHAWELLREKDSTTSRDLANSTFGAFFDDRNLGYTTNSRYAGYGLWDSCVRDALKQLPGVDSPPERGQTWKFIENE